jgi:hypothetical protein
METKCRTGEQWVSDIYEKYCPRVIKEEIGKERMMSRMMVVVEKLINKYRENITKAKNCYIEKEVPLSEEEDTLIKIMFDLHDFDYEKLVKKFTCGEELPDELNYSYYDDDVDARGKMRIVNHMHIGTLLYDELRDYIYKLHHCLVITDIILRLGYDVSPATDDAIYDSIHISFLTFMQNEV